MLAVTELNRLEDLASLRDTWRRLLLATPHHTFFQTFEWLQTTWDHYLLPQKLRVLVIERAAEPIGIVPFCVRTEQRKIGRVRVLTYPLDDWGVFFAPLGPEPQVALAAAIKHVAATPRDWDLIDLRWVDEAAPEFMAAGEALRDAGLTFIARPRMEARICRMTDGWDAYQRSRSRNWRREMKKNLEVLEQNGGEVQHIRYRPTALQTDNVTAQRAGSVGVQRAGCVSVRSEAEHEQIFNTCLTIAEHSWQSDVGPNSTLSSPGIRELLRQLHRQAAALGMLDTNILTVGGRPVAFNYNYVAEGRTYGLRCGFDETAGLENCGKILLYKMLEDSFARGDQEYNFGPGRQPYKDRFATEMRHAYTFRHYARYGVRSQLLNLKERVSARLLSEQALIEKSLVT
jgi:CelD/BcsL family acetyltransferase involved in cellulose biosynthesis